MLLPSPTKATRTLASRPRCSRSVKQSESTWQGWCRSERPLMTGTRAPAARSTTLWWRKVRAMTRSTHRSRLRAMSPADSRSPRRMSPGAKWMAAPPSCTMPTSKVTRVRRLGFSKIMASVRPASSGCGVPARSSAFRRLARARIASISWVERSAMRRRSRFIDGPRSCERPLEDREPFVDLRARDDERGQEAEHAFRRAVDEEAGLAAAVHDGCAGPLEDGAQHEPHATHLLDAVASDEHLPPVGERAQPGQVVGGRDDDAALALDRLDHDGDRLVAHGGVHGGEVAVGDEADAGQKGEEARVVLLLSGRGEGREGAAVEGAGGGEDLEAPAALLRAPAPRELHRGLVRLGAAVREEDALGERVPAEERAQLAGGERVVDVGGVEEPRRLRPDRLHHRRMAVAQVVHREAREEVEVARAVGVPQLRAAPAHERHRLARVDADLVRGAQRDHLGVGQSVSFAHAPTARLRVRRAVRGRISVPTPREVSTSSSTAWRTRPSITCAWRTPPRIASRQHSTLGIMPPAMVPSRIMSAAASAGSVSTSAPSRLFTPSTSVSRMSFSARSASATLPATTSALML